MSLRCRFRFGEGYVAFLRFSQPVTVVDLRQAIAKYLPQAIISSRQATAARLLLPRSQDMALSVSFSMVKLLAEELKATDYTLTQSSLDQVRACWDPAQSASSINFTAPIARRRPSQPRGTLATFSQERRGGGEWRGGGRERPVQRRRRFRRPRGNPASLDDTNASSRARVRIRISEPRMCTPDVNFDPPIASAAPIFQGLVFSR